MKPKKAGQYLEYVAFRIFSYIAIFLPEVLALLVGSFLGWIMGTVLRVRRTEVEKNLLLAFPDSTDPWRHGIARASYMHLGREAVATIRLSQGTAQDLIERTQVVGMESFQRAIKEGRGVILITGHLGNWEVGGGAFTARGISLDAVAKDMANKRVGEAISRIRKDLGIGLIHMDEVAREVPRSLLRSRVVAIPADQHAHKGGVPALFFGSTVSITRAPAVFAIRTGAPMFVGIALRNTEKKQYYTVLLEKIDFEPSGKVDADIRELTVAHSAALERAVRGAPGQYFWQHRRWKGAPTPND